MAVGTTLGKLSVNASGNGTLLMPKLQFRFRLNFVNFGTEGSTELTRQVIDCSRPNLSFQKINVPVYNSTIYLAGKHTWQTMSINVRDNASGEISRLVGQQLTKQLDFAEQASAAQANDYKFQLDLEMLDGGNGQFEPVVIEKWELGGCFLESVNYNTVNYANSEVVTIALTVSYDNAIQLVQDTQSGVGLQQNRLTFSPLGESTGVSG
jgi:hypothetical protein